jgi:hypothetical protein
MFFEEFIIIRTHQIENYVFGRVKIIYCIRTHQIENVIIVEISNANSRFNSLHI